VPSLPADAPRCPWAVGELYVAYHDEEWGVPTHDERELFELLCLEGAQAGLAWITILRKRETYRAAFAGWDPEAVARFGEADRERLLADPGIVRNRLKVDAAIGNARALLALHESGGTLHDVLWDAVDGAPILHRFETPADVPAETDASRALSKRLKGLGFRFVGPTIVYALMQSAGLVGDHLLTCAAHPEHVPPAAGRGASAAGA
jgi:DNA-3-methyladenine glycosylase I